MAGIKKTTQHTETFGLKDVSAERAAVYGIFQAQQTECSERWGHSAGNLPCLDLTSRLHLMLTSLILSVQVIRFFTCQPSQQVLYITRLSPALFASHENPRNFVSSATFCSPNSEMSDIRAGSRFQTTREWLRR